MTNSIINEQSIINIKIPILTGSYFDLTLFDFSFKNIAIYDIKSDTFEKYIESIQPDKKEGNFDLIKQIKKEIRTDFDKKFAIVNINPRANYNFQDLLDVWKLLLIIFPSDLQLEYIINFEQHDGIFENYSMTSFARRITGEYPGEPLMFDEEDLPEVNEFIKLCFDRMSLENYIGVSIENYLNSFTASHLHYRYLTLCIALESIINGSQEITHRLRRTVAILCGKDAANCDMIYDNLNKLYSLRSKIIHGEKYSIEKVREYMQPLQSIVSRTIIELLIHNVPNNKELNDCINRLAFGDRSKISKDWKSYQLNIFSFVDSNWKRLK